MYRIYTIVNQFTGMEYVGSTGQNIEKRAAMRRHYVKLQTDFGAWMSRRLGAPDAAPLKS